jgi:hypothetical protein
MLKLANRGFLRMLITCYLVHIEMIAKTNSDGEKHRIRDQMNGVLLVMNQFAIERLSVEQETKLQKWLDSIKPLLERVNFNPIYRQLYASVGHGEDIGRIVEYIIP